MSRTIPIAFIPGHLALSEAQAFEVLGLNDGRSELAKKKALYRICAEHDIKPLPGRVFPLKKLETAMAA